LRQSAFLTVLALLPVALLAGSSIMLASRHVTAPVNRRIDRLLLVDDNPINQKVCRAVLGRLGYDVDVAADGLQALQQVSAKRYAAILMDCQMPNMDGYQATQTLRRREGPDRHTPVIAMPASAMTTDRDRCLQAGMDDYLTKPPAHGRPGRDAPLLVGRTW
jgi:CheY-like chemotaxis protein